MTISKQQMDAALARMPRELAAKTLNMEFEPHFLGKNKFAYRQERFDGDGRKTADWMLYDAKEGGQTVLAEGPKLAESLEKALGRPVDILTEEITVLGLEETGFKFRLADGAVYTVHSGRLARQKAALPQGAVLSPDGSRAIWQKEGDLYLRDENGRTHRLTQDGRPDNGYGLPDLTKGDAEGPCGVLWSPDNRHFITYRTDYTGVRVQELAGQSWPCPFPGDEKLPESRWFLGDAELGTLLPVKTDVFCGAPMGSAPWCAWSEEGGLAILFTLSRDFTDLKAWKVACNGGKAEILFVEHEDKFHFNDMNRDFYNRGMTGKCQAPALFSEKLGHLYWLSMRSGSNQVWRYDLRNGSSKQMTDGKFQVCQLIDLDTKNRKLYLTIAGKEGNTNPDHRYFYELELQKGKLELLSRTKGDNQIHMAPERNWFLACVSSYDTPQETALHEMDGEIRFPVCFGNIDGLEESRFVFPIPLHETGADGKTEIRGMMFMPVGFDGDKEYPVVDLYYGGPQKAVTPVRFSDTLKNYSQVLSALGFVSVIIDGRGTPGRGKKFLEYSHNALSACGGLADHVALLIGLLDQYPFLDREKVGVLGHSAGGFAALHCLADAPELYKAAAAGSGLYDLTKFDRSWSERFMDKFDSELWAKQAPELENIQGKLLLAWGDRDTVVHPDQSAALSAKLQELGICHSTAVIAGGGHMLHDSEEYCRAVTGFLADALL